MRKLSFIFLIGSLIALFACQSMKSTVNLKNQNSFVGEHILWPDKISSHLDSVTVDITFPKDYKILDGANPYIKLMTPEGKLVEDHLIEKLPFTFIVNKKLNSSQIFADLSIYYCRDDEIGMCLKKNVLYEINVDKESAVHKLNLNYTVQEVNY